MLPMKRKLLDLNHEVEILTLPGHGENRDEAKTLKEAQAIFHSRLTSMTDGPFIVVAFSYGATYLQNWLSSNQKHQCQGQVLLAPALYIRRWSLFRGLSQFIPKSFYIKSLTPRIIRRYPRLYLWEYRLLFESILQFHTTKADPSIRTLIIIDPKDELIDVQKTKQKLTKKKIEFIEYPHIGLIKGAGVHHAMIHPDFFEKNSWNELISKINQFIR